MNIFPLFLSSSLSPTLSHFHHQCTRPPPGSYEFSISFFGEKIWNRGREEDISPTPIGECIWRSVYLCFIKAMKQSTQHKHGCMYIHSGTYTQICTRAPFFTRTCEHTHIHTPTRTHIHTNILKISENYSIHFSLFYYLRLVCLYHFLALTLSCSTTHSPDFTHTHTQRYFLPRKTFAKVGRFLVYRVNTSSQKSSYIMTTMMHRI